VCHKKFEMLELGRCQNCCGGRVGLNGGKCRHRCQWRWRRHSLGTYWGNRVAGVDVAWVVWHHWWLLDEDLEVAQQYCQLGQVPHS